MLAEGLLGAGDDAVVYQGTVQLEGLDFPLVSAHARVFAAIAETGVETTHLRNGIYAEVIAGEVAGAIAGEVAGAIAGEVAGAIAAGELAAPVGDDRVAPVLRSDLAAATATVLLEDGHEGQAYDLTGTDAVSWDDLARPASERSGKAIPYRSIGDSEAEERLTAAGLPPEMIAIALGFYAAYRAGWSGTRTGDLEHLAGRPATPTIAAIAAVLDGTAKCEGSIERFAIVVAPTVCAGLRSDVLARSQICNWLLIWCCRDCG